MVELVRPQWTSKKVNNEKCHQIGDMVIKFAGHTIQKNIRGADVVARYGG